MNCVWNSKGAQCSFYLGKNCGWDSKWDVYAFLHFRTLPISSIQSREVTQPSLLKNFYLQFYQEWGGYKRLASKHAGTDPNVALALLHELNEHSDAKSPLEHRIGELKHLLGSH